MPGKPSKMKLRWTGSGHSPVSFRVYIRDCRLRGARLLGMATKRHPNGADDDVIDAEFTPS